jgi:hypothetical protein
MDEGPERALRAFVASGTPLATQLPLHPLSSIKEKLEVSQQAEQAYPAPVSGSGPNSGRLGRGMGECKPTKPFPRYW